DRPQRLVLLGIARKIRKKTYITTGEAEEAYHVVCEEFHEKRRAHTQFWKYLQDLDAMGLIEAKKSGEGVVGRTKMISLPGVRRERGITDRRIVWLSHTPGEDYHNPTAIGSLAKLISGFVEEGQGVAVVLLDGIEYISINNGFLQTLMFVEHVNEFVMQRKAIVILPVSPDALEEKELALLERNIEVLESPI